VRLKSGKVTKGRLILASGQIFRNSNLTGSFPTPTSVKDGTAPHLAHTVCSALPCFQIKAAPGTFLNYLDSLCFVYIQLREIFHTKITGMRQTPSGFPVVSFARKYKIIS
jgi:hypothetical protein